MASLLMLALNPGCIVVVNNSCVDGVRNGSETDVDCGGVCPACLNGERCISGSDCLANVCTAGICGGGGGPTCNDGIRNGNETGVDCGGSCPLACVNHPMGSGGPFPSGATTTYVVAAGQGVQLPANTAGYAITSGGGGSYRIVWDANGSASQEFWGSIFTTGTFTSAGPCAATVCGLESNDFVSQAYAVTGGQRIDFDGFASANADGIDFVTSTEPVYFDLLIDGSRSASNVFFISNATGQLATAGTVPFGLTTQ